LPSSAVAVDSANVTETGTIPVSYVEGIIDVAITADGTNVYEGPLKYAAASMTATGLVTVCVLTCPVTVPYPFAFRVAVHSIT
jgi:hypothetical protein